MSGKTLYDKLWDSHLVDSGEDNENSLIYIDRQLLHEVTSPQAFEGLALNNRAPWRVDANFAVVDHNVPTTDRQKGIKSVKDAVAKLQIETLAENCKKHGIPLIDIKDPRQGIVHVVGPELGLTLPGMTIVCGDSHTSTHGALAALAFGIGTYEVEHVLATQCLRQKKMKNCLVIVPDELTKGVSAKDLILALIGQIGTAGGTGYTIEFKGPGISALSIESRMTLCNMTIEAGARSGLVAVDDKTIAYIQNKPHAPKGKRWDQAVAFWRGLQSDPDAVFDQTITFSAAQIAPQVTWGTSPEMVVAITDSVPSPNQIEDKSKRDSYIRALAYMGLTAGTPMTSIKPERVFIGSCTNSRIEDLRMAAEVVKGKKVHADIKQALVVPGSGLVKKQAEEEGLDKIFAEAGFEWREPGCSMCIAMNADRLNPNEHCASTSNRNFEGRQGKGGRTHLMSPAMAAAAAIAGHLVDVREML